MGEEKGSFRLVTEVRLKQDDGVLLARQPSIRPSETLRGEQSLFYRDAAALQGTHSSLVPQKQSRASRHKVPRDCKHPPHH